MKSIIAYFVLFCFLLNSISCSFQESLFVETNKDFIGKNLIISPLSLYQALSLATNGAKSSTLKEMLSVLQSKNITDLNQINYDLIDMIKEFSTVEIANAVMTKFTPLEDFTDIAEHYLAPTSELESVDQVNKWCSEKTHGKITKILDKLEDKIILLILNAVYFKGKWETEFNKKLTQKKVFYNLGLEDNELMTNMMKIQKRFSYYQNEKLQAIELPYKEDSMSAVIILPSKNSDINDFIENTNIRNVINSLRINKVDLELPKFELEFKSSYKKILQNMGMKTAFTDFADFSSLKEEGDLKIDDVIQKTYLKVDEEGTEAAAVTVIGGMRTTSIGEPELLYYMKVNRPFLFLLRNKKFPEDQDLLFMAKIEELK